MADQYISYSSRSSGGSASIPTVATFALLPVTGVDGDVYMVADTGIFYVWNSGAWTVEAANSATDLDTANKVVKRDANGNFDTSSIDLTSTLVNPAYKEGRLFYDKTEKTLSLNYH
jgi:hypothetical protein